MGYDIPAPSILNFYMACWFNVDEVFGTHIVTDTNSDYLNVYANYNIATGQVQDELEITLCHEKGENEYLVYKLSETEKAAILAEMKTYCQEQTGQSLEEYATSFLEEEGSI